MLNSSDLDGLLFAETIKSIFRGSQSEEDDLPDIAEVYLPPYPNPSRYPTVLQNSSNTSTFEFLFQFTPTFSNIFILVSLTLCTIWVIVMNMMIICALWKGHKYDKEHVTDLYLINLLFADVLLGIFVFPFMSIVILVGYFPLSATWCNIWVYFDYYLIIASSFGFAALMCSYLMILHWPEYYPKSRGLHLVFIIFIWALANAPWTAPFINDRVSTLYPKGVCGFSIKKNRYFTIYIGFTGFYIPLGISLLAGIFAVKYLKQMSRVPLLKLLKNDTRSHVHPFVLSSTSTTSAGTESSEFNDLYRGRTKGGKVHFNVNSRPALSQSESTETSYTPKPRKRSYSVISVKTFEKNEALQDSVRRHFPLVATSLILFAMSRSLFYTYFGIGSVVPELFPPDLSHSVYWVMHSYAVAAPIVHLLLDAKLRRSVIRFVNEGTFELPPEIDSDLLKVNKVIEAKPIFRQHVPVSVIDAPLHQNQKNGNGKVPEFYPKYHRDSYYS